MYGRRIAFSLLLAFFLISVGLVGVLITLPLNADALLIDIKPGTAVRTLAKKMFSQGLIPSAWLLEGTVRLLGGRIQAGEYPLAGETTLSFAQNITFGKRYQYSFTIIEGWDLSQLIEALQTDSNLSHIREISFEEISHNYESFLAETYFFEKGYESDHLLARAHLAMFQVAQSIWEKGCREVMRSPKDLIVLGSVIEKEATLSTEKPAIANVLLNRLEVNMRLQADPTVFFAVKKPYTQPLNREDLRTQSPYNTYLVSGLPPGPIGTVSKSAIEAACTPKQGEYYYYVAKGDGTHHFSKTHDEHIRAVNQYIRGQDDNQG
ncbi:MAG: hypothetical protein CMF48_02050 [Legionellales bacterium]|nr:hypothetical protein [Legionellales bacterium]|tara:strand:+ start:168 stop:1130 length:963 start_codon:yes stop_codon:yes gene_type:complete